jgi:hypothetical protein
VDRWQVGTQVDGGVQAEQEADDRADHRAGHPERHEDKDEKPRDAEAHARLAAGEGRRLQRGDAIAQSPVGGGSVSACGARW